MAGDGDYEISRWALAHGFHRNSTPLHLGSAGASPSRTINTAVAVSAVHILPWSLSPPSCSSC